MNTKRKVLLHALDVILFITSFFIILSAIRFAFESWPGSYKAVVSGVLTYILAPSIKKSKLGSEFKFKWIFLKKPISIK